MRILRTKTALIVGAIALAITAGAVGIFAIDDIDEAFAQSNDNDVEGVIEALPASGMVGTWQVAGRTVTVTDTTEIDQEGQQIAVGTWVEVDGVAQADGSIIATEIEVDQPDSDSDDDDGGANAGGTRTGDDDD